MHWPMSIQTDTKRSWFSAEDCAIPKMPTTPPKQNLLDEILIHIIQCFANDAKLDGWKWV
jgi:hypothetical protein